MFCVLDNTVWCSASALFQSVSSVRCFFLEFNRILYSSALSWAFSVSVLAPAFKILGMEVAAQTGGCVIVARDGCSNYEYPPVVTGLCFRELRSCQVQMEEKGEGRWMMGSARWGMQIKSSSGDVRDVPAGYVYRLLLIIVWTTEAWRGRVG